MLIEIEKESGGKVIVNTERIAYVRPSQNVPGVTNIVFDKDFVMSLNMPYDEIKQHLLCEVAQC